MHWTPRGGEGCSGYGREWESVEEAKEGLQGLLSW